MTEFGSGTVWCSVDSIFIKPFLDLLSMSGYRTTSNERPSSMDLDNVAVVYIDPDEAIVFKLYKNEERIIADMSQDFPAFNDVYIRRTFKTLSEFLKEGKTLGYYSWILTDDGFPMILLPEDSDLDGWNDPSWEDDSYYVILPRGMLADSEQPVTHVETVAKSNNSWKELIIDGVTYRATPETAGDLLRQLINLDKFKK